MSEKRTITMDPIREIEMPLTVREVETNIGAGFRVEWMSGSEPKVGEYSMSAGAGVGSKWLTMNVAGKSYAVDMAEFFTNFIRTVVEGEE